MRSITIARNYAEALVTLAERAGAAEAWGDLLDVTAAAMSAPSIEPVLMSPSVTKDQKIAILSQALASAPRPFTLFVAGVVKRGRQMLMSQIADEYRALVDIKLGRVRASVTLAREVDAEAKAALVAQLSKAIGKDVIAAFATDPAILGGTVIAIGDRVYDGSVRKRLGRLRAQLLSR
ncbi:MAG TPA: ATP synthase F1 subunit delta [Gemmatimonadales bacterium]|nr:ATP synthase F1 subunit delta [Gemmatimonadales bacterium]